MNDQSQEIAELRKEVNALRDACRTSLILLQVTNNLALSLASVHHDRALVAQAFQGYSSRSGNHLLNSLASDSDLNQADAMNRGILELLQSSR